MDHYATGSPTADPCQTNTISYDLPVITNGSGNNDYLWGRITGVTTGTSSCAGWQLTEGYNYELSGQVQQKRIQLTLGTSSGYLDYLPYYDAEGNLTDEWVPFPTTSNQTASKQMHYAEDNMARVTGVQDATTNVTMMSAAQFAPSNALSQASFFDHYTNRTYSETRSYNSRLQLTEVNVPGLMHLHYAFSGSTDSAFQSSACKSTSASLNNGQIVCVREDVSGEEISYQYDTLKRLTTATTSAQTQSFAYDGFGNLLSQSATGSGSAPVTSWTVNQITNQISSPNFSYDLNGNLTGAPGGVSYSYNIENRLVSSSASSLPYVYQFDGKRVVENGRLNFYSPYGRKLGIYSINTGQSSITFQPIRVNAFFGDRVVASWALVSGTTYDWELVAVDRLGSVRANATTGEHFNYFPFGVENSSPVTSNDREKFATYTRDATTGLDYADHRQYASSLGRFMTPDPYGGSEDPVNPASWNRYSYSLSDPANHADPTGLCDVVIAGIIQSAANSPGFQSFADDDGAISVYPYSSHSNNDSLIHKLGNVLYGISQVAAQAFGPTSSTYAAVLGLELASSDGVPINVTAFSGGAEALSAAVSFLDSQGSAGQGVVGLIGQITYVAPGSVGPLYNDGNVSVIGGGILNWLVGMAGSIPADATRYTDMNHCGHNFVCLATEFPQAFTSGTPCSSPTIVNQDLSITPLPGSPYHWSDYLYDATLRWYYQQIEM